MARFKMKSTGSVVSVDDETAALLGALLEPIKDEAKPEPRSTAKK